MRQAALALLAAFVLFACSHPKPPVGRWEGTFESADTMIAARFEVGDDGQVRVSAPDLLDIGAAPNEERAAMHLKLSAGLDSGWGDVAPRRMDFDGETFRKPGGIAPQAIWKSGRMELVVYIGTQPGIHIAMRKVGDFSENPFPS
jgi:hypothetical protein